MARSCCRNSCRETAPTAASPSTGCRALTSRSRGPLVEEREPENVLAALTDRDRLALPVAGADPHRQFELVIEIAARSVARRCLVGVLALARGPAHRHIGLAYRRGPAWIGHRNVLVVRVERIVGIAPAAAIGGVMNAGEEIGEIADRRRQVQPAIAGRMQQLVGERLGLRPAPAPSRGAMNEP